MDRLVVDVDQLERLVARLNRPLSALRTDRIRVDLLADLVGHRELGDRVRDSASSWDDNREKILARVEGVRDSARKIGEQFAGLETELQSSIAPESAVVAPDRAAGGASRAGGATGRGARG